MTGRPQGHIFERSLDQVARAALIKGNEKQATPDALARLFDFPNHVGALLMRHEGVCFSVYGENMLVPVLLTSFGPHGLLELLEQGAIKFWLQKYAVMHLTKPQKGLQPLASSVLTSPVHAQPEESIAEVFRRSNRTYEAKFLKRLKRALVESYVDAGNSFAPDAVTFAHEGYKLGRFRFAGLEPSIPLEDLPEPDRGKLSKLANEMHDLSVIANLHMDTLDEFAIARVCHDSVDNLHRGGRLSDAEQRVFAIENVPDMASLFRDGAIDPKRVPKLRVKPDAEKFRRWLRERTADPYAGDVGTEYLAAVAGERGLLRTSKIARAAKALTVSALSTAAGATLAGPVGGFVGAAAGPLVEAGVDLIDEFVLNGLIAGWRPRSYFENVIYPARTDAV